MDEVENERAAVVAWLRSWATEHSDRSMFDAGWDAALEAAAEAIEAGDHMEKQR
jgi:hypothetical protein